MPLPPPITHSTIFLPTQLGQSITIRQGAAYTPSLLLLYMATSWPSQVQRYHNVADGRFWVVDYLYTPSPTYIEVRAAFGTLDNDTLDGIVEVGYSESHTNALPPETNGRFLVKLRRLTASSSEGNTGK